ncbi:sulfotransferase family protein [Porticoccaceae bacterium]|nr:sulfotransferase family protein [Porticoccaceae bacterium]
MTLKVLGAGFGRTGTESLKLALERVGFDPCYHMHEVRQQQLPHWLAAINNQNISWNEIYNGYQAAVDWPTSAFINQLKNEYPLAKVILTTRSSDSWFESFSSTIVPAVKKGMQSDNPDTKQLCNMTNRLLERVFNGDYMDYKNSVSVFNKHHESVINSIPKKELLVYELGSGWEPLCEFLGVSVPDSEYPSSNSRSEFRKMVGLS